MLEFRRRRPGEPDHERLWLAVIGGGTLAGALWLWFGLPTPICQFHRITGVACASCGGTRSFRSLVHGDVPGAFAWNPLVTALLLAGVGYAAYAALAIAFNLPRPRFTAWSKWQRCLLLGAVIALVIANWIFVARRL